MSELFKDSNNKKETIKELIKRLHGGEDPQKIKEEFSEVIKGLTPLEIAKVEETLIKEGMPPEEVHRLCDLHLAVFKESLEKEKPELPFWHPVYILTEEHKKILDLAEKLRTLLVEIREKGLIEDTLKKLNHILTHFKDAEKHYQREENVLFPYLEKHGITQPPRIMWAEHDQIRGLKRRIYAIVEKEKEIPLEDFIREMDETSIALLELLSNHFYKENNILFPTGLRVITDEEWIDIRREFDEMGYCCFTPPPPQIPGKEIKVRIPQEKGRISFETGSLSPEEIESIFNRLPFDITFIDKDDTVRYFSQSKDRIFIRTKAVIGRKVQQCHPQKSIHIVNKILEDFKTNKKTEARFWINLKGRLIYIRYFPVRNKEGEYIGCIEVTQDITDIKKLEGEKRIYNEK